MSTITSALFKIINQCVSKFRDLFVFARGIRAMFMQSMAFHTLIGSAGYNR